MREKVRSEMKVTIRQRLLPLFGFSPLLHLLFFGFPNKALSQAQSDLTTPHKRDTDRVWLFSEEKEEKTGAPKGQTFYRWTDEEGNLFFTDDLTKVPKRFMDRIEALELPPLQQEGQARTKGEEPPPLSPPTAKEAEGEPKRQEGASQEPYVYKEVPFHQFMHIQVGMDEAEVISRLGFPSFVTPSDYFYGDRGRYASRIIRLIYLGNRQLNEKTTVIEIRDGRVVNTERIFPF